MLATASGNVSDDPAGLADSDTAVSTSSAPFHYLNVYQYTTLGHHIHFHSLKTILTTPLIPMRLTLALFLLKSEVINAQCRVTVARCRLQDREALTWLSPHQAVPRIGKRTSDGHGQQVD